MATFQLVIRPDGSALLTTARPLTDRECRYLADLVKGWEDSDDVAIIPDCEVVRVSELEIDLAPAAEVPA